MRKLVNFKFIAVIVFTIMSTLPLLAQPPGGGPGGRRQFTEEDIKEGVKRQTKELGLNADQEKKLTDYAVENFKKTQVEMQKMQGDWEKMRGYRSKQMEERDKKYKEVLTDEQYAKYKKIQEERRSQFQERGGPRGEDQRQQQGGDRPQRGRGGGGF